MNRVWIVGAAVLVAAGVVLAAIIVDRPPAPGDTAAPPPATVPAAGPAAVPEEARLDEPGPALGCEDAPDGAARELPEVIRSWATLACIDTVQMIFPAADAEQAYFWMLDGSIFMLPAAVGRPAAQVPADDWAYFDYVELRPLVDDLRPLAVSLLADHTKYGGLAFETAWQMVVRTNGGAQLSLFFYELRGDVLALLICAGDCTMALDIDVGKLMAE